MKKTKMFIAVLSLAIFAAIIGGCGTDSTTTGALTVTTSSLPGITAGAAYNQTLTASGGTTPYTWSISAGALPAGLSLNTATGAITGTPTTVATTSFTVTVTDSATPAGAATQALSIAVTAPGVLTVTTASLPAATVNTAYSQTLAASGGTAPYTWSISVGFLPAGLNLNTATGAITGTPTAAATTNFTARVTDSAIPAGAAIQALSITVNPVVVTIDGAALYTANCAGCHGALTSPSRQHVGATVALINTGIATVSGMTKFAPGGSAPLSQAQIAAISLAMQ